MKLLRACMSALQNKSPMPPVHVQRIALFFNLSHLVSKSSLAFSKKRLNKHSLAPSFLCWPKSVPGGRDLPSQLTQGRFYFSFNSYYFLSPPPSLPPHSASMGSTITFWVKSNPVPVSFGSHMPKLPVVWQRRLNAHLALATPCNKMQQYCINSRKHMFLWQPMQVFSFPNVRPAQVFECSTSV